MHPNTIDLFSDTIAKTGHWLDEVMLGAQLPMLVRGFYYEGWRPAGRPLKHRHKTEFLRLVSEEYPGVGQDELERAVRGVFKVLSHHISAGEVEQARNQLPVAVRELWETAA